MSYMTEKFNNGEVHIDNYVCGWLFDDGEFRPLMSDATKELHEAGLITNRHVDATAHAYNTHAERVIAEYTEARANHVPSGEELFEMRAAFGEGNTVVDVITGRRIRL